MYLNALVIGMAIGYLYVKTKRYFEQKKENKKR